MDASKNIIRAVLWQKAFAPDLPKVDKSSQSVFLEKKLMLRFKVETEFFDFINTYLGFSWEPFDIVRDGR